MIIHLVTWAFIIMTMVLPQTWFTNRTHWRLTRTILAAIATGVAIGGLISLIVK
jgi:hypothetical protein